MVASLLSVKANKSSTDLRGATDLHTGPYLTPGQTAEILQSWGLHPVPLIHNGKQWRPPKGEGWSVDQHPLSLFDRFEGIGLYGGPVDGDRAMLCLDWDAKELISILPGSMLRTEMSEGRPGKCLSHTYHLIDRKTVPPWALGTCATARAMEAKFGWPGLRNFKWKWEDPSREGEVCSMRGTGLYNEIPPTRNVKIDHPRLWVNFSEPIRLWDFEALFWKINELVPSIGGIPISPTPTKPMRRGRPKCAEVDKKQKSTSAHTTLPLRIADVEWVERESGYRPDESGDAGGQLYCRVPWDGEDVWVSQGAILRNVPYAVGHRHGTLPTLARALVPYFFPTAKRKAPVQVLLPLVADWHRRGVARGMIRTQDEQVSLREFLSTWDRVETPYDQYTTIQIIENAGKNLTDWDDIAWAICEELGTFTRDGVFWLSHRSLAKRLGCVPNTAKNVLARVVKAHGIVMLRPGTPYESPRYKLA